MTKYGTLCQFSVIDKVLGDSRFREGFWQFLSCIVLFLKDLM